jgi:hypothetical protein
MNYDKMSKRELQDCINTSPIDTPDYQKAKWQLEQRNAGKGLAIAFSGLLTSIVAALRSLLG